MKYGTKVQFRELVQSTPNVSASNIAVAASDAAFLAIKEELKSVGIEMPKELGQEFQSEIFKLVETKMNRFTIPKYGFSLQAVLDRKS